MSSNNEKSLIFKLVVNSNIFWKKIIYYLLVAIFHKFLKLTKNVLIIFILEHI